MRATSTACVLGLLLGAVTAGAASAQSAPAAPTAGCSTDDGRERLTADGFGLTFAPPAALAPELSATRGVTGEAVTTWREGKFPFLVDLAPAATAVLDVDLGWKRTSDYDLYVLGSDGSVLAASEESNIETGVPAESAQGVPVRHCDQITVVVRNWAGLPAGHDLRLDVAVTPGATLLSCTEDDAAPGCAGKAAGDAPDAVPDPRSRLYLGGDPGQASMAWHTAGSEELPRGTLSAEQPTGGLPNQYTRPVVGFRDQLRNPFVPHFTGTFEPRTAKGTGDALVWVSSPTLRQGGTLHVDLYLDDSLAGTVAVPGSVVGTTPTPVHVSFPGLDLRGTTSATLQLGTTPAVSSAGAGNPADALFTVHYGSVQFPSRITVP